MPEIFDITDTALAFWRGGEQWIGRFFVDSVIFRAPSGSSTRLFCLLWCWRLRGGFLLWGCGRCIRPGNSEFAWWIFIYFEFLISDGREVGCLRNATPHCACNVWFWGRYPANHFAFLYLTFLSILILRVDLDLLQADLDLFPHQVLTKTGPAVVSIHLEWGLAVEMST